jgi:solute carrier family 25, member 33/36
MAESTSKHFDHIAGSSSTYLPLTREINRVRIVEVNFPSKSWVPFVAGAIGGMSGACLTAPLDVVKTRLQSDFYKERFRIPGVSTASSIGMKQHILETGIILRLPLKLRIG